MDRAHRDWGFGTRCVDCASQDGPLPEGQGRCSTCCYPYHLADLRDHPDGYRVCGTCWVQVAPVEAPDGILRGWFSGRMGRLQFGVYNLAAGLLVMGCVFAVSRMSDEAGGEAAAPLGLFVYLALASRFRVLRLHDLGRSGWLLILEAFAMLLLATSNGIVATFGAIAALPLLALNLGMMLWGAYLTFVPGNPERNAYGDPAS